MTVEESICAVVVVAGLLMAYDIVTKSLHVSRLCGTVQ